MNNFQVNIGKYTVVKICSIFIICTTIFVACSSQPVSCDSPEVKQALLTLIEEDHFIPLEESAIQSIVSVDYDKETETATCVINVYFETTDIALPGIEYTVTTVDGELVVDTVFDSLFF